VRRVYPFGEVAGQVLGYTGTDGNGLGGVEFAFDDALRGENGWSIIQKDGRNVRYSRIGMPKKSPQNGSDVYLTVDIYVQKIVENVLRETVEKFKAKGGMCMVMDPASGEILAMANMPGFDPNIWKRYSASQRINRCISHNYEPGSTFKVITASAALQENVKKESDRIDGNQGTYKIYNEVIRDHKPYGMLTFSEALEYSSNVCFAKIANDLGNERLYKYARNFGLGEVSGVRLPGEETGIVHAVNAWSGRTRVTMAIGQEVSVTLLQMMTVFSAIANNGILVQPRIFTKIVDPRGAITTKQQVVVKRQVIAKQVAARMRAMLRGVVTSGTGKLGELSGIQICGKTGTSQKIDTAVGGYSADRVWASFIGFAPMDKPVLVCGVVIDEPHGGEGGGVVAAPAFQRIMQLIVSHPHLTYAEKLLNTGIADSVQGKGIPEYRVIPKVCALDTAAAARILVAENIRFDRYGSGKLVTFQSPSAGTRVTPGMRMALFTSEESGARDKDRGNDSVRVPNCIGKDMRDAINMLNLKGIVPYVRGTGVVTGQEPAFGTIVKSTVVCTLVCVIDG
jgi:cell division protein FtsI/penicillin-binding protein 2